MVGVALERVEHRYAVSDVFERGAVARSAKTNSLSNFSERRTVVKRLPMIFVMEGAPPDRAAWRGGIGAWIGIGGSPGVESASTGTGVPRIFEAPVEMPEAQFVDLG